jgi:hypothetical protein
VGQAVGGHLREASFAVRHPSRAWAQRRIGGQRGDLKRWAGDCRAPTWSCNTRGLVRPRSSIARANRPRPRWMDRDRPPNCLVRFPSRACSTSAVFPKRGAGARGWSYLRLGWRGLIVFDVAGERMNSDAVRQPARAFTVESRLVGLQIALRMVPAPRRMR